MENPGVTVEVSESDRHSGTVSYRLTRMRCPVAPVWTYGIAVRFVCANGSVDETQIEDIFPDEEKTKSLLQLLAANTVTPVTLRDVVEDYLAAL